MVTLDELDHAVKERRVRYGAANRRRARCCVGGCRTLLGPYWGRVLWLDGHRRGYICAACSR